MWMNGRWMLNGGSRLRIVRIFPMDVCTVCSCAPYCVQVSSSPLRNSFPRGQSRSDPEAVPRRNNQDDHLHFCSLFWRHHARCQLEGTVPVMSLDHRLELCLSKLLASWAASGCPSLSPRCGRCYHWLLPHLGLLPLLPSGAGGDSKQILK